MTFPVCLQLKEFLSIIKDVVAGYLLVAAEPDEPTEPDDDPPPDDPPPLYDDEPEETEELRDTDDPLFEDPL